MRRRIEQASRLSHTYMSLRWIERIDERIRTDSAVHGNHCPSPRKSVKDVYIAPVGDQDSPPSMTDGGHEEGIEQEHGVNQCLDVREILGESQPVDVDLKG